MITPIRFILQGQPALQAGAQRFGGKPAASPSGRGWGIFCGIDAATYVAAMAEVEVRRESGAIKVKRVVCAQDMGQVASPRGAALQMEGGIIMGRGIKPSRSCLT